MSSLVSVITPVFNGQRTLKRAVESMLSQTYPDWEMLIVSDDGSDYRAILTEQGVTDPRLRFFNSPTPASGPNVTRNIALKAARGQLIAPLDADDLYYPTRLQRLVPLALTHGVAGDNARVVVDPINAAQSDELGLALPAFAGVRWLSIEYYCQTTTPLIFVFQRQLIRQGWNPSVKLGEDTLFNLRALASTGGAAMIGVPLHEYRVRHDSLCHADDAAARAEQAYLFCQQQIQAGNMGLDAPEVMPEVQAMLQRKQRINREFDGALREGYRGSYQHYVFDHHRLSEELPDEQL